MPDYRRAPCVLSICSCMGHHGIGRTKQQLAAIAISHVMHKRWVGEMPEYFFSENYQRATALQVIDF